MRLMLATPSVASQSRRASTPFWAKTGMPSFQVARPQRTPEKAEPASAAISSCSMKTSLSTPALR